MSPCLQVPNQVSFHHICLTTWLAAVALDPNVELHMGVQVRPLVEAFGADLAFEGTVTTTHERMAVKLVPVKEDFAADVTLVGLLGVVNRCQTFWVLQWNSSSV